MGLALKAAPRPWSTAWWFSSCDARVYGIFRIGFSAVALVNVVDLWPRRHALFSDLGLFDGETLRRLTAGQPLPSIFHHLREPAQVDAILLVAGAAAILLGLGVAARVAAVVLFFWHCSYTYAIFPAVTGWDALLRSYSFLVSISPLGLTVGLGRGPALASAHGLWLMRLQLLLVYLQTVGLKLPDPYWRNGEFMSYFMVSVFSRFPAPVMAELGITSMVATWTTLAIETAVVFLLFARRTRWIGFVLGFGLHLAIAVLSDLALFSWAVMVPYLTFLDGDDLERIRGRLRRIVPGPAQGSGLPRSSDAAT